MDIVGRRMVKAKAKMEELFGLGSFERKEVPFELAPPRFGDFGRDVVFGTV